MQSQVVMNHRREVRLGQDIVELAPFGVRGRVSSIKGQRVGLRVSADASVKRTVGIVKLDPEPTTTELKEVMEQTPVEVNGRGNVIIFDNQGKPIIILRVSAPQLDRRGLLVPVVCCSIPDCLRALKGMHWPATLASA